MNVYLFQAEVVKSGWRYPISPQKKQAWHRNCYNSNAHHTLFIYWQDVLDYSEPHCITIYGKCHMVLLFDKMWHDMSETSITKVRRHFSPEQFQHSITCMNVLAYFPYVLDTLLIPFFFLDSKEILWSCQMESRWSQQDGLSFILQLTIMPLTTSLTWELWWLSWDTIKSIMTITDF